MARRIKLYTASKLKHAPLWRRLSEEWTELDFVARWPTGHVDNIPDTEYYAKVFWQQDYEDVLASDVVLVFAEGDDKLRGALIEAGLAIAFGNAVIVVGEHSDYGTWQFHPSVHRVPSLAEARKLLECMAL